MALNLDFPYQIMHILCTSVYTLTEVGKDSESYTGLSPTKIPGNCPGFFVNEASTYGVSEANEHKSIGRINSNESAKFAKQTKHCFELELLHHFLKLFFCILKGIHDLLLIFAKYLFLTVCNKNAILFFPR